MTRAILRDSILAVLIAGSALVARAEDDGPLALSDLAAYRAALEPSKPGDPPALPSSFRDLWDHPEQSRGRRVAVSGRVQRVFHQGAVGRFPALAEVWVVDPASDPLCLVFPESSDRAAPKPGDSITFDGTFLRRIRYRGGDVDRLAPLIVGPGPPRVERPAPAAPAGASGSAFDGMLVAVLGGIVVLILLRAHLRRPSSPRIVAEPPPEFQDGLPGCYDEVKG